MTITSVFIAIAAALLPIATLVGLFKKERSFLLAFSGLLTALAAGAGALHAFGEPPGSVGIGATYLALAAAGLGCAVRHFFLNQAATG